MKLKHFVLLGLAVLAGFTSCKENNKGNDDGGDPVVTIIGTWTYSDMTYEFEAEDAMVETILRASFASMKETIDGWTLEFEDNGVYNQTMTMWGQAQNYSGTYTYENAQLTLDGEATPCELTETQLKLFLPIEDALGDLSQAGIDPSTITKAEVYVIFERQQQLQ